MVDEDSNLGVAFVGVNNPYLTETEIQASYRVCSSPLDSHPILDNIFYPDDVEKGILYACQVDDLSQAFEEIPELGNLGLLT